MDLLLSILQFILVFGLLLLVHETGHFIMCRLSDIPVEEYGIGLPPRILKLFTWQGTDFTLNALPFGAFVRPKGEMDRGVEGGLAQSTPKKRLGVYLGGPIMNIFLGLILLAAFFYQLGTPDINKVIINEVAPQSPAFLSGLLAGDQITAINDSNVESIDNMRNLVTNNLGTEITITVLRNGTEMQFKATPRINPPENQGALGVVLTNPYNKVSIPVAITTSFTTAYEQMKEFILMPGRLLAGTLNKDESRIVGIKGIYDMYTAAGNMDSETASGSNQTPPILRLYFIATISIALGLTNLLPIPALDGGRIVLVLPELILHKKIPQKIENYLVSLSFIALLLLMIFITFQDFINPVVIPR